ncbi:MAG: hypothetical protein A2X20_04085 [Bacteroidetes bacterium GWE2_40_15]|nr:MAG: hypothetical protein A2X20_04085 [Bacteroidetes bacterium GWE2_40_15]
MIRNFQYGKHKYEYILLKEERKTISLTVTPELEIIVRSSKNVTTEKIEDFLQKKWVWLEKQLKYFKSVKRNHFAKEFVSGESFYYLGRQYQLVVVRGASTDVRLMRGKLILETNQGIENSKANKTILNCWFTGRAQIVFQERLENIFLKFEYSQALPTIEIKRMLKRWGSFLGKKKIVLHPGLIHASKDCIDYVISHELCHFKYKNHSTAFYRLLGEKCPSWSAVKEKLEKKYL